MIAARAVRGDSRYSAWLRRIRRIRRIRREGVRACPKVPAPKGTHKLRFALLVNGQEYSLVTDPRMTLLDALHEEPISNRSK